MRITIDLDGTIFATQILFKVLCDRYGYKFSFPIYNFEFDEQEPETRDFLRNACKNNTLLEVLFEGKLFNKKIPNILNTINKKHEIIFVSSRQSCALEKTKQQLINNGITLNNRKIYCINNNSKLSILKHLNSNLHIDDSGSIIQECLSNSIPHILYSNKLSAYNHKFRPLANTWTNSWTNIPSIINKLFP